VDLAIVWFILWGVLWAVFFMTDGFDFGAGMLHMFLGKNDKERRVMLNTVGPVWDGNQVWLITAGGATFAAFPTTYALMFSYLYTALLLLLFSLILRGVALEFRNQENSERWKKTWDVVIVVSNFIPALLFGVAFGNIFAGLPMDASGYHGSIWSLLNPYGLLTGVFFVLMFLVHGALFIAVKTEGDLSHRAKTIAGRLWVPLLIVSVVFLVSTYFVTNLFNNYLSSPFLFVVPVLAVAALLSVKIFDLRRENERSFFSSCATVVLVVAIAIVGLYPNLIPSSTNPEYSLTISNSSSSVYTLTIMTIVAAIFVPVVIGYQIWVHKIFRTKLSVDAVADETNY
jgi:cytochrome bd ubiquinol oxidase subunit II